MAFDVPRTQTEPFRSGATLSRRYFTLEQLRRRLKLAQELFGQASTLLERRAWIRTVNLYSGHVSTFLVRISRLLDKLLFFLGYTHMLYSQTKTVCLVYLQQSQARGHSHVASHQVTFTSLSPHVSHY
jgi:hypothetical protein